MSRRITRRTFVSSIAYAGAVAPLIDPHLTRAASANGKLNIAFVGAMGQAGFSFDNLMAENIVAIADVDRRRLRERSALLRDHEEHPQNPRLYGDYREMFDRVHHEVDAFVVATPDHHHAQAALRGMALGKHCYCEKPLAHTVHEVRLMSAMARRNKLATQMGTQIHSGPNYRRVVEKIRAGAIGKVREVHVWLFGAMYTGARFPDRQPDPVPAPFDWDLWLGPAERRPYYQKLYHPFDWRGWWDFGGGGTTDMACHWVDLPHWALDLKQPSVVRCHSRESDPLRATTAMMVEMRHPAKGDRPAVTVTWHLGGSHIDRINVYERFGIDNKDSRYRGSQTCFVGDGGVLLSDYNKHHLLPEQDFADYTAPDPTIPDSPGHHAEWVAACKTGAPTPCNFDYSGALTESVLLGVVSHRAGNIELAYDAATGRVTNHRDAMRFVTKPYRKGWEIERIG